MNIYCITYKIPAHKYTIVTNETAGDELSAIAQFKKRSPDGEVVKIRINDLQMRLDAAYAEGNFSTVGD